MHLILCGKKRSCPSPTPVVCTIANNNSSVWPLSVIFYEMKRLLRFIHFIFFFDMPKHKFDIWLTCESFGVKKFSKPYRRRPSLDLIYSNPLYVLITVAVSFEIYYYGQKLWSNDFWCGHDYQAETCPRPKTSLFHMINRGIN